MGSPGKAVSHLVVMRGLLALWLLACSTRAPAPGGANETATQLVARAGDEAMRARRRLSVTHQEIAKLVAGPSVGVPKSPGAMP